METSIYLNCCTSVGGCVDKGCFKQPHLVENDWTLGLGGAAHLCQIDQWAQVAISTHRESFPTWSIRPCIIICKTNKPDFLHHLGGMGSHLGGVFQGPCYSLVVTYSPTFPVCLGPVPPGWKCLRSRCCRRMYWHKAILSRPSSRLRLLPWQWSGRSSDSVSSLCVFVCFINGQNSVVAWGLIPKRLDPISRLRSARWLKDYSCLCLWS
jgi:hypothetical protein